MPESEPRRSSGGDGQRGSDRGSSLVLMGGTPRTPTGIQLGSGVFQPTAFAGAAIYNAPMLIKKRPDIRSSEITPKSVYLNRRDFLTASSAALVAAGCGSVFDEVSAQGGGLAKLQNVKKSPFSTTEKQNTYDEITSYNNFYEFGTDKGDPKEYSGKFRTKPWSIAIEGEVAKPA